MECYMDKALAISKALFRVECLRNQYDDIESLLDKEGYTDMDVEDLLDVVGRKLVLADLELKSLVETSVKDE